MKKFFIMAAIALAAAGCSTSSQTDEKPIGPTPFAELPKSQYGDDYLTPEALWAMGRIGGADIHPTTGHIIYSVTYYSVKENRSNSELFVLPTGATEPIQLTFDNKYQGTAHWMSETEISYISTESGSAQVWKMALTIDGNNAKAGKAVQLTDYEGGIDDYAFSPDFKKLLFVSQVKTVEQTADVYPDLDKASGHFHNDLMYKHWDEWTETAPHPFVAEFDGKQISQIKDLLEGEKYESPMKPFGGIEQLAWSPDGKYIAYTCRKKTGLDYAVSTNSDIYLCDLQSGETRNLTEGMMGYDINPAFSPDGSMIAWQSMERDGYESDQNRLMVMTLANGEKSFVSQAFESSVDQFIWLNNSELAFAGVWHALAHIYTVNLKGEIKERTQGQYDFSICGLSADNQLLCKRHSMREPDDLYMLNLNSDELTQLTRVNNDILSNLTMGEVVPRWQTTTDGKQMLTWIIYPPHFDPNKKYPTLLYCEGGPQSPVSQFWSYRWNFMMMAANNYIIVAPNRRGLPGFGNEWNEAISGDYGGQCMRDYLTAIDEFVAAEPYVDKEHLGCVGASFGGFSVYWLAGHHDKRFKAFIAHDGIFNMEMQYLETEEKWFANWDMGGAYWDKNNPIAQRTFENSPHRFVDKWDTPILCIHGEKDYRILANQAMAAFDAAKMRGIEAELLIFPDENHWVLKPQNGILWQRRFYNWLDRWLK
ncbi:MAG: S9 family peptidase [Bacteroidales bacterium]|nr:S9 family peptidase [Bacteroidales bacterium]